MFCSQFDTNSFALIPWTVTSALKWCLNWAIPEKKHTSMGRGVEDIILWKIPWNYLFALKLEIPGKANLQPWKFHKFLLDSLEVSRPKTKTSGKFHILFSWKRLKIALRFSLIPGNSTFHFDSPGSSISSTPTTPALFVFLLDLPITWLQFWHLNLTITLTAKLGLWGG